MTMTENPSSQSRASRLTDRCASCGLAIVRHGRGYAHVTAEAVDHRPQPTDLWQTEAHADDADGALALWGRGFRPLSARFLAHGMEVAFRETDAFGMGPVGKIRSTRVEDAAFGEDTDFVVRVSTFDRGLVEVDDDAEVWVK